MTFPSNLDVTRLLRLTPLITTTSSLLYAFDSNLYLGIFAHGSQDRKQINGILRRWFTRYFAIGGIPIVVLNAVSIGAAIANIRSLPASSVTLSADVAALEAARRFYYYGLWLTVAHFTFAPKVIGIMKGMVDGTSRNVKDGDTLKDLENWLFFHRIRMVGVDFPGWVCCLLAVLSLPRGFL